MSHIDQQATRNPEHYCMGDNSNTNDKYGVPSSWKMAQSILGKRSRSSVKEAQFQSAYITMHKFTSKIFSSIPEIMKTYIFLLSCLVTCALATAEK